MTPSTTVDTSDDQFTTLKQAIAGQADNSMSGGKQFYSQCNNIILCTSDKIL